VGGAALLGLLVFAGLLANGRPIGTGRVLPFAPAFDATGGALVGKVLASTAAAVAASFLFLAVGRRRPQDEARTAALLLAFGTTVWAAAQSFSVTPFATALVAGAVLLLVLSEDDPALAPRAGLPLALAVAIRPTDLALALVLLLAAVIRRPRQIGLWALWSAPGIALAVALGLANASILSLRLDGAWASRLAALWVSPAAGLLVFAPVVLVGLAGLVSACRREDDAPLAAGCALALLAHGLVIAARPLVGETWGPREWSDAMPLALLFLPEGLDRLKGAGTALAFLSVAIQALGAFTYDGRWDRLFAPTPETRTAVLWDVAQSPIPFQLGERVFIGALPQLHDGKVRAAEHRIVLGGPEGSRVTAASSGLVVEGADATFGNVCLLSGARVQGDRIRLQSPGDAVAFRLRSESRLRLLEVRVAGRGQGTLALGESSFWSPEVRIRGRAVSGDFHLRFPYHYPESGGDDLRVLLASGSAEISSLRLVPPTEPENVIRLSGPPDR
jgi:hypothetical protein